MAKSQDHYTSTGIADRLLSALREAYGDEVEVTPDRLAPLDHFHTRGLAATKEMIARLKPMRGEQLLDVGAGLGGPARWIAATYDCRVIGIDLTSGFCQAAIALNRSTGMEGKVQIIEGNALDLPLDDSSIDRAYSHNVSMNIGDKLKMYQEIVRVLKPGGLAVFSNIGAGAVPDAHYPVPWASSSESSFLTDLDQTKCELVEAGLEVMSAEDATTHMIEELSKTRRKIELEGRPTLSIDVLMGPRMVLLQDNLFRNLTEGRMIAVEVTARKPNETR